ncbi:hypothetical protein BDEG_27840 [Batrachochytrium dendrobatidis JEL423]|uniref:Uncharacterized protein n=1 Tax=Batrachochytrium dendrobatidis (strain JEL423) TaxID=403673 RepID=A0A177WYY3_BATDL|nr:hypothetical protein BDEG_27840 [Batrachochytrium dendrobatidis JEL423]
MGRPKSENDVLTCLMSYIVVNSDTSCMKLLQYMHMALGQNKRLNSIEIRHKIMQKNNALWGNDCEDHSHEDLRLITLRLHNTLRTDINLLMTDRIPKDSC